VTKNRPARRRWITLDDYGPDARNRVAGVGRARKAKGRRSWLGRGSLWLGAILAGTIIGSGAVDELIGDGREVRASATTTASRASFDFCHQGGGSNCVVDGDTFYLAGEKIRIAGIDAPETHPSRCPSEAALGNAATARLQELLSGGAISLSSIDRDRDRYGRLLRNVAVDGQDVGDTLVAEGVARPYGSGRRSWCD
jgi:endonuclease YncB( thermonuclease family)